MEKWIYSGYLDMDKHTKEFHQKMLYLEYLEISELHLEKNLTVLFLEDLYFHEDREQYETCQLYKDTFVRFKKEITGLE